MREVIIILNTLVKSLRCNSTCKAKRINYLLKSDSLEISLEKQSRGITQQQANTVKGL